MNLNLNNLLIVSALIFIIGLLGFIINRKNVLILLLALEVMLLSINMNFIIFSVFIDDLIGQMFTLIILTVAACESALGLAILIVYYRIRGGIKLDSVQILRS